MLSLYERIERGDLHIEVLSTSRADLAMLAPVAQLLATSVNTPWMQAEGAEPEYFEDPLVRAVEFSNHVDHLGHNDVVIVAGDRHELITLCVWLKQRGVRIVHIGGGDVKHIYSATNSSFVHPDHLYRDAISMLADWHFVANEQSRMNLRRLDIPLERIVVSGLPSLDKVYAYTHVNEIPAREAGQVLYTYHSNPSLKDAGLRTMIDSFEWLTAQQNTGRVKEVYFSYPGDDRGGRDLAKTLRVNVERGALSNWKEIAPNTFYERMAKCEFALGNSSAFRIEAGLFGTPCIELGTRQQGRELPPNYYQLTGEKWQGMADKILRMLAGKERPDYHHNLWGHPKGRAAETIVENLCELL